MDFFVGAFVGIAGTVISIFIMTRNGILDDPMFRWLINLPRETEPQPPRLPDYADIHHMFVAAMLNHRQNPDRGWANHLADRLTPTILRHIQTHDATAPNALLNFTAALATAAIESYVRPDTMRGITIGENNLWSYFQKRASPMAQEYAKYNPGVGDLQWGDYHSTERSWFPELRSLTVPLVIPNEKRFEHTFVVAPTGSGKTTLMTSWIVHDLGAAALNEATVIIIDSTNEYAKNLTKLHMFSPSGGLHERLIYIDANDVEHPTAVNLFDMGAQADKLSPRDREAFLTQSIFLVEYVFRSLLGEQLTSRQSTLWNFTAALLFRIPFATLDTILDIMEPNGIKKYADYVAQLDADGQRYFTTYFETDRHVKDTRAEVVSRIYAIKRIPAISRLFSAPETRLDLFEAMSSAKVIVINAAQSLLSAEGVQIYTRFWLASIMIAAQRRDIQDPAHRMPTYVYIDECATVVKNDEKLPAFLDEARKLKVGLILLTQRIDPDHMSPSIVSALLGSTATRMAGRVSDAAAHTLARNMQCEPGFFATLPPYHLAASSRGVTNYAVRYQIPHITLPNTPFPAMSEAEYQTVIQRQRDLYSYRPEVTEKPQSPPEAQKDDETW